MATRPPRFTAIPPIPQTGLSDWQYQVLNTMKDNIELLIGAKTGANSDLARAVTKMQITVQPIKQPNFQQLTAQGAGFTISGAAVVSLDDYNRLLEDFIRLAKDVADIRAALNVLINQLKG